MSRARELAKVGGKNQQVIAGLSTHVGVSTFAANVNMLSGLNITGPFVAAGNILPDANGTRDLGSNSVRWQNVYTSDLDLSNEAKGGNTVDGSWGSWLIEEGENDLFLKNRRTGKTYKFMLQEV